MQNEQNRKKRFTQNRFTWLNSKPIELSAFGQLDVNDHFYQLVECCVEDDDYLHLYEQRHLYLQRFVNAFT